MLINKKKTHAIISVDVEKNWVKALNVIPETMKVVVENTRKHYKQSKKYLDSYVYCSTIHNRQDTGSMWCSSVDK
jgi:inorganic pyrophosphatase